jgi:hypothetical protein
MAAPGRDSRIGPSRFDNKMATMVGARVDGSTLLGRVEQLSVN